MNVILGWISNHHALLCAYSNCLGQWGNGVGILWYVQCLVRSIEYMKGLSLHTRTSPNGLNDDTGP